MSTNLPTITLSRCGGYAEVIMRDFEDGECCVARSGLLNEQERVAWSIRLRDLADELDNWNGACVGVRASVSASVPASVAANVVAKEAA